MNDFAIIKKNLSKVYDDLKNGKLISKVIIDNEDIIVYLNAQEQLYEKGINALGVHISDYMPYKPLTIRIKKMKGQPTDRVTLRDEGDFEKSFYLSVNNKEFEIKASDWKAEDLVKKYGKDILGLSEDNINELVKEYIVPAILEQLKDAINDR